MNSIRTIISMQATIEIWVFAHHARYSGLVMHFLSSNVAIYAMMSAINKKPVAAIGVERFQIEKCSPLITAIV